MITTRGSGIWIKRERETRWPASDKAERRSIEGFLGGWDNALWKIINTAASGITILAVAVGQRDAARSSS